jgi:hypothetical protein
MDTWNREELYAEIWEQPASKVAAKYGVSDVMLGKVCRRLSIPVPGRGYWARKAAGQKLTQPPLPALKKVPFIQRFKMPDENAAKAQPQTPLPDPTDAEYLLIKEFEASGMKLAPSSRRHSLVVATERAFRGESADLRGRISTNWNPTALNITISRACLERALKIMNELIRALETMGFPVAIEQESRASITRIFGHNIRFEIVETYRQIRIPESERTDRIFSPKVRYEPTGILEFRGSGGRWNGFSMRDGKSLHLEDEINKIVAKLMREARTEVIQAEERRQEEIRRRQRELEREKLGREIADEEKRVANLDAWVTQWIRAKQYRDFIECLQAVWEAEGLDLSAEAEKGKRIIWMKQQADRLDPFVERPPSILDRKHELNRSRY